MSVELDIKEIVRKNVQDPVHFLQVYLSEWFPTRIPWVHRGLLAIMTRRVDFLLKYGELDKIEKHFVWCEDWQNPDAPRHKIFDFSDPTKPKMTLGPNTAVMMPRGFSKTTIANGVTIYKIVHLLTKFTLYTSESSPHAAMQMTNVKEQLESNEKIRAVYGNLVGKKWTEDYIETTNGVTVAARGRGGQIRGLIRNGNRPDNIICDDIEDEESVDSDTQRKKTQKWFFRAVMPAIARRNPNATITVLDTLKHADALILKIADDPRFNFIRFAAIDPDGEALWESHMSLEQIETEKQSFIKAGELAAFYMEYMSQLSNAESSKFKSFTYVPDLSDLIATALACDPAISEQKKSDFFCLAVAGMTKGGIIKVVNSWGEKGVHPRQQVDKIFEMYEDTLKRTGLHPKVGIEGIAYQRALIHLVREEMFRKKRYFEIVDIKHGNVSKVARVEGILQPRYANGYVVHTQRFVHLESQLLDWPNGKRDFPDALAMAVSLLDPYASAAAGGWDLEKDEYEELEMEYGGLCP
jgi:hypothetical protein